MQYVLDELQCAADEVRCLAKAEANEIANSIPDSWIDGRQPDLPVMGERRYYSTNYLVRKSSIKSLIHFKISLVADRRQAHLV